MVAEGDPTFEDDGYVGKGNNICVFCSEWRPRHSDECPWQALVRAVAGEESE